VQVHLPRNQCRVQAPRRETERAHVSVAPSEWVEALHPGRQSKDRLRHGKVPRVGRDALDLNLGVERRSSNLKNGDANTSTSSRSTLSLSSFVAKKSRKSYGRWQLTEKLPGGSPCASSNVMATSSVVTARSTPTITASSTLESASSALSISAVRGSTQAARAVRKPR
jgi:hypothetical protein